MSRYAQYDLLQFASVGYVQMDADTQARVLRKLAALKDATWFGPESEALTVPMER